MAGPRLLLRGLRLPMGDLGAQSDPPFPLTLDAELSAVLAALFGVDANGNSRVVKVDASGNLIVVGGTGATLNTSAADYAAPNAAANGTQIVAANPARKSLTLKNTGTIPIRVGATAASVANATAGHQLAGGDALTLTSYSGAIFGNGQAAGGALSYIEEAA